MEKYFDMVAEFQVATDQPVNDTPTLLDPAYESLRFKLMREENEEYQEATDTKNLKEVLDSCIDQMYVLIGTINSHGLSDIFPEAFKLVHDNNMTKVVDGKVLRDTNGKIIKPEGFVPVDLRELIKPEYKPKKNFYPIKAGDEFLCTVNYILEDGTKVFTKGISYSSELDGCITNDFNDIFHNMSGDGTEDDDAIHYFKKI